VTAGVVWAGVLAGWLLASAGAFGAPPQAPPVQAPPLEESATGSGTGTKAPTDRSDPYRVDDYDDFRSRVAAGIAGVLYVGVKDRSVGSYEMHCGVPRGFRGLADGVYDCSAEGGRAVMKLRAVPGVAPAPVGWPPGMGSGSTAVGAAPRPFAGMPAFTPGTPARVAATSRPPAPAPGWSAGTTPTGPTRTPAPVAGLRGSTGDDCPT
jgi:hypothetical protein